MVASRELSPSGSGPKCAAPDGNSAASYHGRLMAAVGSASQFEGTFSWRTHSPERAARLALEGGAQMWAEGVAAIAAAGADAALSDSWSEQFLRKWLAYQRAGSRVMNWMITGPARFPVARNKKRMDTEMKRLDELLAHVKGATKWARRRLRSAAKAEASAAAKAPGVELKERAFGGGKIVLNTFIDRVQIIFDDRPAADVIQQLKGRAFRWSPREGAWQRQLTQNGAWAAEAIAKAVGTSEPASSGSASAPQGNSGRDE